jgi:5-methylcytosine-specific restriction endonuclease McrA
LREHSHFYWVIEIMGKRNSLIRYEERYEILNGERSDSGLYWLCVYCGQPADTRDHVPPISRCGDYEALKLTKPKYLKVPACKNCNSIASNSLQETIFSRIEFVKDSLIKKYAKKYGAVEWDQCEIDDLGPNLKSHIKKGERMNKLIRSRVEYYGGYEAIADKIEL